jgi:lysine 6-dehydrogenase
VNYLVIGAGMMGSAAAYDLAHASGDNRVVLADIDEKRAEEAARSIGPNVRHAQIDVADDNQLRTLMRSVNAVICATSYTHNLQLTKAAIASRVHLCDLGGNMDVVDSQLALHAEAQRANVVILPNCGLAPGLACVVAAGGAKKFQSVQRIRIRVGGLPQHPKPPLNYQLVFSAEGLINEYLEPAEVLRKGEIAHVSSMTDNEQLSFPPPFGSLEAFNTSGGVSTLTRMFRGSVRDLDYKTIRYPGHCERFKTLLDLGFASAEPIMIGNTLRTARELFEELLRRKLPANGPDVVLMRVTIEGLSNSRQSTLVYQMVDHHDAQSKLTSMMRTTAFPTSVIAQFAATGVITDRGVIPPEQCVPLDPLIGELRKRGINISETFS